MQRQQCKTSKNIKSQGNMTPPKDHNNLPVIDLKQMEICNVSKTEFKMEVLRKLNDVQENTKSQHRGALVAQSVKHLPSAPVMILGSSPLLGSLLSRESASPSTPPPSFHVISLTLSFSLSLSNK